MGKQLLIPLFLLAAFPAFCQKNSIDSSLYYLNKGDSLYFISEYEKAQETLIRGLSKADNPTTKTQLFNSLGNVLTYMGKKEEALRHYQEALRECRNSADVLKFEATLYKNISALYQESRDYKMAFEYMTKAEKAGEKWNDSLFRADLYNNKGLLLEYADSLPQAVQSYLSAYSIFDALHNEERMALCANNLGVVYKNLNRTEEAIYYYGVSLNKSKQLNNEFMIAANYINLGNLFTKTKQYNEAKTNYDQGLIISRKIGQPDLVRECLEGFAKYYEAKGDYKNALHYQQEFQQLSDSLLNKERIDAVAELETRFGLEKKELELVGLANEKKLMEDENQKKQLYILLLVLICALLIGGIFVGIRLGKLRRHKRELELVALTEKQERDRIAQDMHDELGSGISRINWITNSAQLNTANDEDKQKFARVESIASQLSSSMKSLIWLLYSGDCKMDALAGRIREMASQHADDFDYDLDFDADTGHQNLTFKQNAARDIFLMIKECVNNVSKHANAKTLSIKIKIEGEGVVCTIQDDGNGFVDEDLKSGNGLNNLKRRTQIWNGEVKIESQSKKGTEVAITMPLKFVTV